MTGPYSRDDLSRFERLVRKQSNPDVLRAQDIEDLVQDLLVDALTTTAPPGTPLVARAVKTALWTRYYTSANKDAFRVANEYRLGVDGVREDGDGKAVDPDQALIAKSPWVAKQEFVTEFMLRDLIARLPLDERQAFTLCGEWDLTLAEAAVVLGVSPSTVSRSLARARTTLQQQVLAL